MHYVYSLSLMSLAVLYTVFSLCGADSPIFNKDQELLSKRGWANFQGGYGKRAWNNFGAGYGKRTSSVVDEYKNALKTLENQLEESSSSQDKRGWNNGFTGGMGKRAWNNGFTGGMGKRAWNSGFAGGMGKRAWNSGFAGGMGKRAWNSGFAGGMGKRSSDEDFQDDADYYVNSRTMTKRNSYNNAKYWVVTPNQMKGWNNLDRQDKRTNGWLSMRGMWGKRSNPSTSMRVIPIISDAQYHQLSRSTASNTPNH